MNKQSFNITPHVALAIGIGGEKVWREIDRIYKKDRYRFYQSAKMSRYYNHTLITGGDIYLEEYGKKTLGILEYAYKTKNLELLLSLKEAMKKNKYYKAAIKYAENSKEIDLDKLSMTLAKQFGAEKLFSYIKVDLLNSIYVVALFVGVTMLGKTLVRNEASTMFFQMAKGLEEMFIDGTELSKRNFKNADVRIKNKALAKKLFGSEEERDFIVQKNVDKDFPIEQVPGSAAILFLFNVLDLSVDSVLGNVTVTDKDLKYIFTILESTKKKELSDEDSDKLLMLYYLFALAKAYKDVKKEFFKNNKETMFAEVESYKKKNELLQTEYKKLEVENKRLKDELKNIENQTNVITKLEKEIEKLKEQIREEKKKDQELNALREFVFSLKTEHKEKEEQVKPINTKGVKGVFIGGYDGLFAKLKPYLTDFSFIPGEAKRFDENMLDNVDIVVLYPEVMSHALYYFAVEQAKKRNMRLVYVSGTNINQIIKKIRE